MSSVLEPVRVDGHVSLFDPEPHLNDELVWEAGGKMSPFAESIYKSKYAFKDDEGNPIEEWPETAYRVVKNVMGALGYGDGDPEFEGILRAVIERKFLPGGRYLYAAGRELHQVQNCLLLKAEDSREGWADLWYKSGMALMTGAGIGVDYSDIRPAGSPIRKTGGVATGPIALMHTVNELGRKIVQGGTRRSAIWAGLSWKHKDVEEFIRLKDWSPELRALKDADPLFPMPMELTNISVLLDDEFFAAFEDDAHELHELAQRVYWLTLSRMLKTAEPGFSIDVGENAGETLRNACTEITSHDDSDICNLGSINMGRVKDLDEFRELVRLGTLFLLAGTVYSDLPYDKVHEVREKNRRLGLGLMGIHDWLLQRGYKYEPNDELEEWLRNYEYQSRHSATIYANEHNLSIPVKVRAIAPTGTIGIIGETTTGIEPIFCKAYKRMYLDSDDNGATQKLRYQYVVDPTVKRLVAQGVDPNTIEDAYSLSLDVERRVEFQAWVQQYVDHGISSTINLPYPIEDDAEVREFGNMLYKYLPKLRGVTVYPDGARGGQPLSVVPYQVASEQEGVVFEESEERCNGGSCGI